MQDSPFFLHPVFATEIFGNPFSDWLTALAVALAINVIVALLKWMIIARLSKIAERTVTSLDDALIAGGRATRQFLIFFPAVYVGAQYLILPDRAFRIIGIVATVAAFLQIGLWLSSGFRFWMERYRARAVSTDVSAATSLGALAFIGQLVLWSVVVLVGLDNLGVNVTTLVAGLGVGGIAVALAVQNILGDLFASLSIVIDKPFVVGDFIIVDDYLGTVEYVGLKTTRIRSLGGEQLVFSNSDLLKARVRNYKRMYERRIVFNFRLRYQTAPDQVLKAVQIVKDAIAVQSLARFDRAHFGTFGESALEFEVVYWMKDPDYNQYMDTQQAINLDMMRAFEKEGIVFAHPVRTLMVREPLQVEMMLSKTEAAAAATG
jgi:small-conductance mechanosensitive channel